MDPNEAYRRWWRALLEENADEAREAYLSLRAWFDRGGFEPGAFGDPKVRRQFFQFDLRTGRLS